MNVVVRSWMLLSAALLAAGAIGSPAAADVFVLASGGRVEGELLNPDQQPRTSYIVRASNGVQWELQAEQVQQVVRQPQAERRYEQLLPKMPDTVEGHLKMAQWCKEQRLTAQRTFHLEQVLARDTDNQEARLALGYTRIGGKWARQEQWMKDQGFVRHAGSWRTLQEIELAQRRKAAEDAQRTWRLRLKSLHGKLGGRDAATARAAIAAVRDPVAAPALVDLLESEQRESVRLLLVETLGESTSAAAVGALIRQSLTDDSAEVRDRCMEALQRRGRKIAAKAYVAELESKDNTRVNRAGEGLTRMKEPSTILPLIDALTTEHKFRIGRGNPGQLGASFGGPSNSSGAGGLSVGGRAKIVEKDVENPRVLDAMLALTDGVNFRYDKQKWRQWYAREQTPVVTSLRRDR